MWWLRIVHKVIQKRRDMYRSSARTHLADAKHDGDGLPQPVNYVGDSSLRACYAST